jgi:hypothetical protein
MRPSFEAQIAIEQIVGASIDELWTRYQRLADAVAGHASGGVGLRLLEMAAVVTECVKAAGKERDDKNLIAFKPQRVAELIAKNRFAMNDPILKVLTNMLFGGADPKKDETASPATSPSGPGES